LRELASIDFLDEEKRRSEKWQEFDYKELGTMTDKAVLIDEIWVPKSQLRVDGDNKLWMSVWFNDKHFTQE